MAGERDFSRWLNTVCFRRHCTTRNCVHPACNDDLSFVFWSRRLESDSFSFSTRFAVPHMPPVGSVRFFIDWNKNGSNRSMSVRREWIVEFLERDGLGALLSSLRTIGGKSLTDTMAQLQCVECLRAVVRSRTGLQYISTHLEYAPNLASGMCTHLPRAFLVLLYNFQTTLSSRSCLRVRIRRRTNLSRVRLKTAHGQCSENRTMSRTCRKVRLRRFWWEI